MAGIQQDDPYHHALVVYGEIEVGLDDNPEENPEGGLAMGQEESDEGKNVKETPSKPHPLEPLSGPHTIQESDTDYIHSLEKEIANLKRQLFVAEARAVQAEQREEVITQEVNELAELLQKMSFHRNNGHTLETPLLQMDFTTFQVAVTAVVPAAMAQLNANNTNRGGNSIDNTSRTNDHGNQRVIAYQGTPNPKTTFRTRSMNIEEEEEEEEEEELMSSDHSNDSPTTTQKKKYWRAAKFADEIWKEQGFDTTFDETLINSWVNSNCRLLDADYVPRLTYTVPPSESY
ncbi:unnamed protein product [Lactuca saligna]|uniref:Uncharacterized protein n=1 Tax=Lactuca saligna TaxID=75948 RepID=A0AA36A3A0_LACSI|nr:unnamed protein product [Lactuca saligna]